MLEPHDARREAETIATHQVNTPTDAGTAEPPVAGEYRWLVRVGALACVFAVVMMGGSLVAGIPPRDPHGSILLSRVGISLGLFVVLSALDALLRSRGQGWSARKAARAWRERWTPRRLALTLVGLLAYHLVYFSYHNLKSWDVFLRPRDGLLLRWDRWLFFGHSPAVLLHDLLGQHVAAYVLMVVYESFSTIVTVALVAALVFTPRVRDGFVYVASAMWVWILGVGSYYLIPSLGPFHSAPREFAGLPHLMIQDTQARYLGQRAHLLAHPQMSDAFAQISAFASLHVAVTALILLMARYYRLRRTTIALGFFLAGTMIATVYLGWHFAVDDVAGLLIAVVAVKLGRLMVEPRRVPRASAQAPGRVRA